MAKLLRFNNARRSLRLETAEPAILHAQGDRDLLGIAMIPWVASVFRVASAVAEGEVFGAEASLALLCVVFLPWLLRATLLELFRRPARLDANGAAVTRESAKSVVTLADVRLARARRARGAQKMSPGTTGPNRSSP